MRNALNVRFGVVMSGILMATGFLTGCDNLARSQGKFPIASSFGSEVLSDESVPLNPHLFVPRLDKNGVEKEKVPLVRVAYRSPWDGKVINTTDAKEWDKQSYYMVLDVTNLARDPSLQSITDPVERKKAYRAVAEMLVVAADWNGDVYWRHLSTFLETYQAANNSAKTLYGGAIAGAFISPVLAASLAGTALTVDTFVTDFTGRLDINDYADLRVASSIKRTALKEEMFSKLDNVAAGKETLNQVFHLAYDYAFTYSIKGALKAASKNAEELEAFLITGESKWSPWFTDAVDRYEEERMRRGKLSPQDESRVRANIAENKAKRKEQEDHEKALLGIHRERELAEARERAAKKKIDADEAVSRAIEAERKRIEAEKSAGQPKKPDAPLTSGSSGTEATTNFEKVQQAK